MEKTIAAISTAPAPGGIGIVRLSGRKAFCRGGEGVPGRQREGPLPDEGLHRPAGGRLRRRRGAAGRRGGPGVPGTEKLHRGGRGGALLPRGAVCDQTAAPGRAGCRGLPCRAGGVHPPGLCKRQAGSGPGRGGDGAHRRQRGAGPEGRGGGQHRRALPADCRHQGGAAGAGQPPGGLGGLSRGGRARGGGAGAAGRHPAGGGGALLPVGRVRARPGCTGRDWRPSSPGVPTRGSPP